MIHTSIACKQPTKQDGVYVTSEFINFTKYLIFQDLFSFYQEHKNNFGDLVICLDKSANGYWRKDVYAGYKASRKKGREESDINYGEVFAEIDSLIHQLTENLPWKVISVPKAEADDIMLVLAREYNKFEKVLIHSPDKDMLQAQRDNENVFQYSALTKKWLKAENKHENMDHWIMEHVCLGDGADEVPRIVDHTEFSPNFIKYLKDLGVADEHCTPYTFKENTVPDIASKIEAYNVWKTNKKGEPTELDVYVKPRFGSSNLKKAVEKAGSLDAWLDSHPLYREHYKRNFTLVMEEGIPEDIWNKIVQAYKDAKQVYNNVEFEKYLKDNELSTILMELSSIFTIQRALTADDFSW